MPDAMKSPAEAGTRRGATLRVTAATAVLALVLAGCSAEDDPRAEHPAGTHEDAGTTDHGAAGSAGPGDENADGAADDVGNGGASDPGASVWQDETDPSARLAGCVVGTWSADNDRLRIEYVEAMTRSGLRDVTADVSGALHLALPADGTYVLTADRHHVTVEGDSPGGDVTFSIQHDGTESGAWTSGAGTLTIDG